MTFMSYSLYVGFYIHKVKRDLIIHYPGENNGELELTTSLLMKVFAM